MKKILTAVLAALFTASVPFASIAQDKRDCSKMADAAERAKCERDNK